MNHVNLYKEAKFKLSTVLFLHIKNVIFPLTFCNPVIFSFREMHLLSMPCELTWAKPNIPEKINFQKLNKKALKTIKRSSRSRA